MRTSTAPVVLLLALAAGVSGCSRAAEPTPAPSQAPSTAVKAAAVTDARGAIRDLDTVACVANKSGAWSFSGLLRNRQQTPQTYTVTASVVRRDGWTVQSEKTIVVTVPARRSARARASKFYTSPKGGPALQCVTRVTRKNA